MSMILTIANSTSLVIAADTKASSTSGLLKYPDIHKIKKINSNCGIAISGQFKYGETLLAHALNCLHNNNSPQEIVSIINSGILDVTNAWHREMGSLPDCTLIVSGVGENNSKYFCLITINGYDVHLFETSFSIGKYNFLFANPKDVIFEQCRKICEMLILKYESRSIEEIATKIVEHIASISNVVNGKVDTLTFPLQSD